MQHLWYSRKSASSQSSMPLCLTQVSCPASRCWREESHSLVPSTALVATCTKAYPSGCICVTSASSTGSLSTAPCAQCSGELFPVAFCLLPTLQVLKERNGLQCWPLSPHSLGWLSSRRCYLRAWIKRCPMSALGVNKMIERREVLVSMWILPYL